MVWAYIRQYIYCLTRWLFSAKIKIKIPDLQSIRRSLSKRELQTITFYPMAHKKEEGTYHRNEKCLDSSALGKACLSSSGINKGQRVPDRSKGAHRKPLVKCSLTVKGRNQALDPQFSFCNDSHYLTTVFLCKFCFRKGKKQN